MGIFRGTGPTGEPRGSGRNAKGRAMSNTTRLRVEVLEGREVPAGDLASALQLTGLPAGTNLRVASDLVGNTIVAGTFTGSIDLDPTTTGVATVTAQGASDVFVAKYGSDGK